MNRRIVIAGGSGYLGRYVAGWLAQRGWDVVTLSRSVGGRGVGRHLQWDGKTLDRWAKAIDGADVVLNLAGRSVNCRYNEANKREIYASRLDSTRVIGQAIAAAAAPPPIWLNAASATIYRHAEDRPMDEITGEIGDGFSVDVCQKWEAAFFEAPTPATRKVALRAAMVMGPGAGGPFAAFYNVAKLRLGGALGSGDQYVSWMHIDDFCRSIEFLIDHPSLDGPVNLAAPNPVPNRQFMRALRKAEGIIVGLPAMKWMLEVGAFVLRTETELLLKSRRVVPTRLSQAGFQFDFPEWSSAAADLVTRHRDGRSGTAGSNRAAKREGRPVFVQGLESREHI